jgi:hypothetical protein
MAVARIRAPADDLCMEECQTCGLRFDERAYQVIVWGLGAFDSVDCAEKALRRRRRKSDDLAAALERAASHLQPHAVPPPKQAP